MGYICMYVCAKFCWVVIVIIIIRPEDLWAILSGCDDEFFFFKAFLYNWLQEMGSEQIMEAKHNGLWFMCKCFGHFCSGWATWCTRPSSDIGEWSKYHRECNRYEFLHFSVLFVSIPGCCCCFPPLEGEVKTHHLISLKKDADILIGSSYWKDFRSFAFITKSSSNLCLRNFFGTKKKKGQQLDSNIELLPNSNNAL